MTHPDWQGYLDGTLNLAEQQRLETLLREDPRARSELRAFEGLEHLIRGAQAASRFACPDVETLGAMVAEKKFVSDETLVHMGSCRPCQEELQKIRDFHASLETPHPSEEPLAAVLARGKRFLEGLFFPAVPLPAYAVKSVATQVPCYTCGPLSKPVSISFAENRIHLEVADPTAGGLVVTLISETGESHVECKGKGRFTIELDRVWEIQIQEVNEFSPGGEGT